MTSFANMTQSLAASLPSTSAGPSGVGSSSRRGDSMQMSNLLCNILDTIGSPSNQQNPGPSSSSNMPYDIWALQSGSSGQISIREYNTMSNNNNQSHSKEDTSSGSPGASSSVSLTCFRCEERTPTIRCLECNDIFCHECCHKSTSDCQKRGHTLLPNRQISPIGVRPNSVTIDKEIMYCDIHGDPVRYYCEGCLLFICQECSLWLHKDHIQIPLKGALGMCKVGVYKVIEDTKIGTKAIKSAIDRAVAMTKAFEKETSEANIKIRKAMRCFTQAIEDREKYLLDKVEKMRQAKLNELTEHMNTLRGILAGLAHTNETLLRSMDLEGIELFMAKEKGKSQLDYFACMFKTMHITEERIVFIPPNYDLIDQIKRQCDVLASTSSSMVFQSSSSWLQPRQSQQSQQYSLQPAHTYGSLSYQPSYSTGLRALPGSSNNHTRSINYYDNSISPRIVTPDINYTRGIGQAINGYWLPISLKPPRSQISGVPVLSFGREGQDEGQVSRPWGLCVDREGKLIVADRRNNRIQIFSSRGDFIKMFGSKGTGPGEFDLPAGITTDSYGRIIVVDKDNHRVQIFSCNGVFLLKFGSFGRECGQFQYPWDVAVNTLGNIVVTDTRNHRIQLFNGDGRYITQFLFETNPAKLQKGPTTPRGVGFTVSGNIIVSDFENHRLLLVDSTLSRVIYCIGREGSCISELNRPSGIITDDEGRIIVADSKNHRVLVFTSELRILFAVDLKSPGLDDKDRPSDVALTPEGNLIVLFETLPDTARDVISHGKQYIKIY